MCNACGFLCCAYDAFEGCGCDHCSCPECWSDEPDDMDDDEYFGPEDDGDPKPNNVPADLQKVLGDALAAFSTPNK